MRTESRLANLIILAGPNGSGKSTFFDRYLAKWGLPFVNPDIVAKEIAPNDPMNAALKATKVCDAQRQQLLAAGRSFVTEGIRPDCKLIEDGQSRGYFVRVIFVCVESPDMNIGRVLLRVAQGGHEVPLGAIPRRYERSLASIPEAARIAEQVLLFDNSVRQRPHRLIARFERGELVALRRVAPHWAQRVFGAEFERFRR